MAQTQTEWLKAKADKEKKGQNKNGIEYEKSDINQKLVSIIYEYFIIAFCTFIISIYWIWKQWQKTGK